MGFFSSIGQGISNAVQWTGETAKSAGSAIADGASAAWTATKDTAVAAGTAVKDTAVAAGTAVKDTAVVAWDKTADAASAAGNAVANAGATAYSLTNLTGDGDAKLPKLPGKEVGYPGHWSEAEGVPKQIKVKLPFERGAQKAASIANAQTGADTTVQTPAQSFIYLDVGRWGGTTSEGKRDFGIVCGGTAALCAFTKGSGGRSYKSDYAEAVTKLTDGPDNEKGPINALLGKLAGTELGTPVVRRYLWSKVPLPPSSSPQKVYIIFGDMHLPVVTKTDEKGNDTAGSTQPTEQADLMGRRVGRTRRVDMGKDLGIESDSDAVLWHEKYVAAEIFEDAGKDLSILAGLLSAARGNLDGAELWVLQLGDMFDLWLGFDCFFQQSPPKGSKQDGTHGRVLLQDMQTHPPSPEDIARMQAMAAGMAGGGAIVPFVAPKQDGTTLGQVTARTVCTAKEFVDTWVNRTMYKTSQGADVRTFLESNRAGSTFLYGNHDNYFGNYVPPDLQKLNGGLAVLPKEYRDPAGVLYASHGHQWDSFNRDGAIAGEGTTQAAFWGGQAIRKGEALSDSRDDYFLGAVHLLRSGSKPFKVFAMGHTHTAVLTEVVIEMEPEPQPIDYTPMLMGP